MCLLLVVLMQSFHCVEMLALDVCLYDNNPDFTGFDPVGLSILMGWNSLGPPQFSLSLVRLANFRWNQARTDGHMHRRVGTPAKIQDVCVCVYVCVYV